MRKMTLVMLWMLFGLVIILPVAEITLALFDYSLELISYTGFAVFTATVAITATGLTCIVKEIPNNNLLSTFIAILPFLALVGAVLYLFEPMNHITAAPMWVTVVCSFILCIRFSKPIILKVISLILSSLAVIPVIFFTFIALTFGRLAVNTVVETVYSPNGSYYVEVIDSDQGALGGDTFVELYEKSPVNLFFIKISKKPERIYRGDWGIYNALDIYWKDDGTLMIGSSEYRVE